MRRVFLDSGLNFRLRCMGMDASDLRIFEAVARLGGMNRAAAELNTVQSNVTARIRALEAELQVSLFRRTSRGAVLTAAGQRLLPYAGRVAQLLDEARRATRDDGTPRGPLVVGSLETTAALRLTPCLASFLAAFPGVDLTLRTGTSSELIEAVLGRRLEGAFVAGPVDHPELAAETIFREELVILSAPGDLPIARYLQGGDVRIIVLRAGCSYRLLLESWLAQQGVGGGAHARIRYARSDRRMRKGRARHHTAAASAYGRGLARGHARCPRIG